MSDPVDRAISTFSAEIVAVGATAVAGPVVGAAALVATGAAVDKVLAERRRRQRERVSLVVAKAAGLREQEVEEFLAQLGENVEKQVLFMTSFEAAAATYDEATLLAAANSLAKGSAAHEPLEVSTETRFMRALRDVDDSERRLLQRFMWSAQKLGLSDKQTDNPEPVDSINRTQLELAFPEAATVIDGMLASLQRHGLVRPVEAKGGFSSGGGLAASWEITEFGRDFLDRLEVVGGLPDA